jgi:hypothetical protein
MERDRVVLTFHIGKRYLTMVENNDPTSEEAREALDSIKAMESAGYRRAVPQRWFGAGVAFFIASLFALYALEDPYPYIVFPLIGMGVFIVAAREKVGAYGRDFPSPKANRWGLAVFAIVMVLMFFGTVVIRRTYDAAWVPVAVGIFVGLVVFLVSESERRSYLAKAGEEQAK